MKKLQIGVIGSAGYEEYTKKKPDKKAYQIAYEVGKLIALNNAILVCGGKGGIMQEACRGAKEKGGITVGIISGNKRNQANEYIDVEVVSGIINCSEESLIVSMSDGLIAIGGGSGTLQELALAYRNKKPIIAIKSVQGWANKLANTYLDERQNIKIIAASSADGAVKLLLNKLK
ncbi:MAG: TIGR00725 family protein [Patescibacteria group bacterium]|nr:TIGR00725 family protein [Patescibacteria group bacterium]